MANTAGITLNEAIAASDAELRPAFTFADLFENDPEFKARRDKTERLNELKRRDLLQRRGSVKAVFDPTPWELLLRSAVETFSLLMPFTDPSGTDRLYTAILDGEICSDLTKGTELARKAIRYAFSWPETLADAFCEIKRWYALNWERSLFAKYGWWENAEVEIRKSMIEQMLNSEPVRSWEDLQARFDWNHFKWSSQWLDSSEHERDEPFIDRLNDDFRILRQLHSARPTSRRRRPLVAEQGDLFSP
ncbi:hypothetical protein OIU34_26705 [Pararhizobium sp. BT-229]|uniref:hypothetical protein n=1 Tax=Pararhizobium sp. BT-229 TaxID=2986923 RepID=UPI0021F70375|nr:hypothetical protein [Pararhizobium sp. BT-229]MCV9965474.1 hypothetical protein [Pararhizobium sp. BT-229]